MPARPPPLVPAATPIDAALDRSEPLAQLRRRLADSQARLDAVVPLLPAGLAALVAAGPVDDEAWTLLVRSNSAAAKIRQLRPRLEVALREQGWQVSLIRVKVQSR